MSKDSSSSSGKDDNASSSSSTSDNSGEYRDSQKQQVRRRVATSKRATKKNKRRTVKSRAKKKRKSTYRKRAPATRRSQNKKRRSKLRAQSAVKLSQTQINILTSEIRRSFEKLSSIIAKKKRRVKRKTSKSNIKKGVSNRNRMSSESIDSDTGSSVSSTTTAKPSKNLSQIIESRQDMNRKAISITDHSGCKTPKFKVETPPYPRNLPLVYDPNLEPRNKSSAFEEYPNGCYKVIRVRTDPPYGIKENGKNEKVIAPIAEVLPTPREIAEQKRCMSKNSLSIINGLPKSQKSPFWRMLHTKLITPKTGPPQRSVQQSPPKIPKTLPFETNSEEKSFKKSRATTDEEAKSKVQLSSIPSKLASVEKSILSKTVSIVKSAKQKSEHSLASLDPVSSSSSEVILNPPDSDSEPEVKAKDPPKLPSDSLKKQQLPLPIIPKSLPKKQLPIVQPAKSTPPPPPPPAPKAETKVKAKDLVEAKAQITRSDQIMAKRKLEDSLLRIKKVQDKMPKASDLVKKVSDPKLVAKTKTKTPPPPPLPRPPKKSSLTPPPPVRNKDSAKVEAKNVKQPKTLPKSASQRAKSASDKISKVPSSKDSGSKASLELKKAKSSSIKLTPTRDSVRKSKISSSDPKLKAKPKTQSSVPPPKTLKKQSLRQVATSEKTSPSPGLRRMDKRKMDLDTKPKSTKTQTAPKTLAKKVDPITSAGSLKQASSSLTGKIKVTTLDKPKMDLDTKPKSKTQTASKVSAKKSDPIPVKQESIVPFSSSSLDRAAASASASSSGQLKVPSGADKPKMEPKPKPKPTSSKADPIQVKPNSFGSLSSAGSLGQAASSSSSSTVDQPKMDSDSKLTTILQSQPPSPSISRRKLSSAASIQVKSEASSKNILELKVPQNDSSNQNAAQQVSTESFGKSSTIEQISSSELNALLQPELESNSEMTKNDQNATDSTCSS